MAKTPAQKAWETRRKNQGKWIQGAIKKEGALTQTVQRRYGSKGFTRKGTIKLSVLRELVDDKDAKTRQRATLALTLRGLQK